MTAWASFISDELEYSIFDSRGEFNERHSSNDEICLQVDHGDVFDSGNRNEEGSTAALIGKQCHRFSITESKLCPGK